MKKNYQKPTMTEIILKSRTCLLTGSGEEEPRGRSSSKYMGFDGSDASDNDYGD